ncbi:MAG: hypothetical protein K2F89_08275, partial [Treponemataceae bacterium]|nr:hypothetical protein [Treponemataceae bacterium]
CTVSFTASGSEYSKNFDVKVTRGNIIEFEKSVTGTDEVRRWCPISFDQAGWKYEDSTYGWWD